MIILFYQLTQEIVAVAKLHFSNNFHLKVLCFYVTEFGCICKINFSPRSSKSDSYDRVSFDRGSDSLQMTLHDESESNYKNLSQGNSMGRHSLEMLNRDSISGASEYSGPPSSQYTDMSCENLEHSIASGSSRSSFSLQNPVTIIY